MILAITCMGQALGVYKYWGEVPFWSNIITRPSDNYQDGELPPGLGDDGDEEVEKETREQRAGVKAADDALKASEERASDLKADEDHCPVKEKGHQSQTLKKFDRGCQKHHFFVVGTVLGMDGVQQKVQMIVALSRPIWTHHSEHARTCRAPSDTKAFYLQESQQRFMSIVSESAAVLMHLPTLKNIGFETEFAHGPPKRIHVTDDVVQAQSALAVHMVALFIAWHRITRMLWHCRSWPGLLAGLCSEDPDIIRNTFTRLREDFRVFKVAESKRATSSLIAKLLRASSFTTRATREVCLLLTMPLDGATDIDREWMVIKLANHMFAAWGQTKVCDFVFRELRDREQRDTTNSNLSMTSYDAFLGNMGTITSHKRKEITFEAAEPQAKANAKEMCWSNNHDNTANDQRYHTDSQMADLLSANIKAHLC